MKSEILVYPYTYQPAHAEKYKLEGKVEIKCGDSKTDEELPYFGYGAAAQQRVNEWLKSKGKL